MIITLATLEGMYAYTILAKQFNVYNILKKWKENIYKILYTVFETGDITLNPDLNVFRNFTTL